MFPLQLPCATCSPMTTRLHEHATGMMSVHCLRLLMAPLIESVIIQDRIAFLRENNQSLSFCLPLFDPLVSPRNFAIIAFK